MGGASAMSVDVLGAPVDRRGRPEEQPEAAAAEAKPLVKASPAGSKPRIDCIDGCRFALVLPIIVGHFIKFGTSNPLLLKLLTQENVLVGGFFLISGYVHGYVSTKMGECKHDEKKLAKPELFFWQKVMTYYPMHFVVSTFFSPMFIILDRWYKNSWKTTSFHALLNYTLLQAWFPSDAEIWNPPTWFLSALTFANACLPTVVLPQVSKLSKDGLQKLMMVLGGISVLQKVSYSQAWQFTCRGNYKCPTTQPHLWNITRFHPMWALIEVTMGVAAARQVMLDEPREQEEKRTNPLLPFLASYASLALRATRFNLNDALIRSSIFLPLYTKFLKALHRDCVSPTPSLITRFFSSRLMTYLGSLAFPMFILHGPIGQLFYKRKVAIKLWGRVMPKEFFPIYLAIVGVAGHLMNEYFVKNKSVQALSGRLAQYLARHTDGMLHDAGRAPALTQ